MYKIHNSSKNRRKIRSKKQNVGEALNPRVCIFRSNKYIYAQVVNDNNGVVLFQSSSLKETAKISKIEKSKIVGLTLADKLSDQKIKSIIFDRNGYKYHGRVKALAEAIRSKGISF